MKHTESYSTSRHENPMQLRNARARALRARGWVVKCTKHSFMDLARVEVYYLEAEWTLRGHTLVADQPAVLTQIRRQTCSVCGKAELIRPDGSKYGSATEEDCTELWVVRLWDGFDGEWMDVSDPLPKTEAELLAGDNNEQRKGSGAGNRHGHYGEIDYYAAFPAGTVMHFSEGRSQTHASR